MRIVTLVITKPNGQTEVKAHRVTESTPDLCLMVLASEYMPKW